MAVYRWAVGNICIYANTGNVILTIRGTDLLNNWPFSSPFWELNCILGICHHQATDVYVWIFMTPGCLLGARLWPSVLILQITISLEFNFFLELNGEERAMLISHWGQDSSQWPETLWWDLKHIFAIFNLWKSLFLWLFLIILHLYYSTIMQSILVWKFRTCVKIHEILTFLCY